MRIVKTRIRLPKVVALLSAFTLANAGLLGVQSVAYANPDTGKLVATRGHIDEPKAFWENDNFVLRGEFDGHDPEPRIEDTVIWIGKGWKDNGESAYTFVVPDAKGWDFLGKPGQVLYRSPAIPSTYTYAPAWVGMGADGNIPTEKFRDAQFSLDLVGFNGPGRMEMFNLIGQDPKTKKPLPPRRMFSSHDPRYRSFWMSKGNHTHNQTTFTKPGRYELTYRVTARGKDGQLIASQPQTVVWQVGGSNPKNGQITDWKKAFEQAKQTSEAGAGKPYFGMAPYPKEDIKYDGDQFLTDLYFDTGNEQDYGRLVITVDGFFLDEVSVKKGKGGSYEMLGDLPGDYQALYIPQSGPTGRFRSAIRHYQRPTEKQAAGETPGDLWSEETSETTQPPKSRDLPPDFDTAEVAAKDTTYTMETEPTGEEGLVKLHFHSSNPKMRARLIGGSYSNNEDKIPTCQIEAVTDDQGNATVLHDTLGICEGKKLSVLISPHPLVAGESAELKLDAIDPKKVQRAETTLRAATPAAGGSETQPSPGTNQPATTPSSTPSESDNKDCSAAKPCVFTKGHLDIFNLSADPKTGALKLEIKEDITGYHVRRPADSVILKVIKQAYQKDTSQYSELGNQPMYLLPFVQDSRLLWPGWDTLQVGGAGYNSTTIHLDQVTGPQDGQIYAYTPAGRDGGLKPVADSQKYSLQSGETITIPYPAHAHLNWGFTRPGKYTITAHMTAKSPERAVVASNTETYTFLVERSEADTSSVAEGEDAANAETSENNSGSGTADNGAGAAPVDGVDNSTGSGVDNGAASGAEAGAGDSGQNGNSGHNSNPTENGSAANKPTTGADTADNGTTAGNGDNAGSGAADNHGNSGPNWEVGSLEGDGNGGNTGGNPGGTPGGNAGGTSGSTPDSNATDTSASAGNSGNSGGSASNGGNNGIPGSGTPSSDTPGSSTDSASSPVSGDGNSASSAAAGASTGGNGSVNSGPGLNPPDKRKDQDGKDGQPNPDSYDHAGKLADHSWASRALAKTGGNGQALLLLASLAMVAGLALIGSRRKAVNRL